ncbi:MAG: hypothetical protein DHS20C18_53820 [Saprospiraceae bacterium]|nr:MAG: hypothetical protein DHS20C18_53820 [Saprospiraceae bacterium]
MKNLLTLMFLVTLLGLWACEETAPTTSEEGDSTTEMADVGTPINPPTCQKIGSFEIDSTCAHQAMAAWDQVVANIKAQYKGPDDKFLVQGFAIKSAEIDSMQAELDPNGLIYGMIAVEKVDTGGGKYEDMTRIIFMGKPAASAADDATAAVSGYKYFNFTVPCPNTCPQ